MLEHNNSIYILCRSSTRVILEYDVNSDTISWQGKFIDGVNVLDFGDVYNYGDTERILFVGGRTSEAVIYISKTLLTNISIHADIGSFSLSDDIYTLSNVQPS